VLWCRFLLACLALGWVRAGRNQQSRADAAAETARQEHRRKVELQRQAMAVLSAGHRRLLSEPLLATAMLSLIAWAVNPAYALSFRGILSNDYLFHGSIMLVLSTAAVASHAAPRGRPGQFSLRTVFAAMTVCAVLLSLSVAFCALVAFDVLAGLAMSRSWRLVQDQRHGRFRFARQIGDWKAFAEVRVLVSTAKADEDVLFEVAALARDPRRADWEASVRFGVRYALGQLPGAKPIGPF
jgi:hypothetical protein